MKLMIVFTLGMVSVACVYASTANCPEISRLSNQILGLHHRLFRRMQKTTKLLQSAVFQTKCIAKRCYMTDQSGQLPPPPGKLCCPKDWQLINGICYFISLKKATWFQSQIDCRLKNATLVRPDTSDKIRWVSEVVNKKKINCWLDITDLGRNGKYKYFNTGGDVHHTDWGKGQPNGGSENCIISCKPDKGKWHDYSCSSQYESICEKPADLCCGIKK